MAIELGIIGLSSRCAGGLAAANVVATIFAIGPSVLRATSGLAEKLRETIILGIFSHVVGPLPAFTPEGIVVGF